MVDGDRGFGEGKPKVFSGSERIRKSVDDCQKDDNTERVTLVHS